MIRRAIDNLPTRLRETFILHFYQELSYQEIAQQQNISYQNVCKRISQARKILQEELRGYFIGEEGTHRDKSVPPAVTKSEIGEISLGNGGVEARAGETVLAVAVEEVESVGGEDVIEVMRSGGACCSWQSLQRSESDSIKTFSHRTLEVKREDGRCVGAQLCESQSALIWVWPQFDGETDIWQNFCWAMQGRREQSDMGKYLTQKINYIAHKIFSFLKLNLSGICNYVKAFALK